MKGIIIFFHNPDKWSNIHMLPDEMFGCSGLLLHPFNH
jgi:hypothetical protein